MSVEPDINNDNSKTFMRASTKVKNIPSLLNRAFQIQKHFSMASVLKIEDGAYRGLIESNGQFPPEKGRYHLYIGE